MRSARVQDGLFVGTSGWTYQSWRGRFYPHDLAQRNWLGWYAGQFSTTEINGSFYRTPSLEAVAGWKDTTPPGFVFAWKASQFITHWKRLNESCENSLELMETRLKRLGTRAGPVLFQLPARFEANRDRLVGFLRMLPRRRRYAFEFRHASWFEARVLDVLTEHDVALCLSDHQHATAPWTATASYIYIRGHGPGGDYRENYPTDTLRVWARRIRGWRRQGKAVFVYFDNDHKSAAPADARRLLELLGRGPARIVTRLAAERRRSVHH